MLLYYPGLMLAWIAAWLIAGGVGIVGQSEAMQTVYWTAAKLLIWLLPVFVIIKLWINKPIAGYLSIRHARGGVVTGVACGVGFALLSFARDFFTRTFGVPTLSPGLINALLIAPVFEELLFRGFILKTLQRSKLRFWPANIITSGLFLGIHLPGWYFMASPSLLQGSAIVGIVLVGLGAGFAKQRSGSLWGSIVFHAVNNLYSAFLR